VIVEFSEICGLGPLHVALLLDENAVCWEHGGSSWVVDVWEGVNWLWSKWVVLWNDGSWLTSKLELTISYKLSLSGG